MTCNQANTSEEDSVAELYCTSQRHSATSKVVEQMLSKM
jgi:hypothetical protein